MAAPPRDSTDRPLVVRAVYTAVLVAGIFLMAPVFLYRALRHRKYLGSLSERFGNVRLSPTELPTLWIHAVSVGEVLAAEPFVRAAAVDLPDWRIAVSTTTATGQQVARERFPDLAVFYFPLDLPGPVARAFARVRPSALCLVETEIWPNVLAACRHRGIPVAVVNGRLSDNSYRRYHRVRGLLRGVLSDISLFLMQSPADADRMRSLGADASRVLVTGNLKYDVDREDLEQRLAPRREGLERAFGLPDPRPLIVAGSTGPGEEALLLDALTEVRRNPLLSASRLLIAPRRPERFDEVATLVTSAGFRCVRRSVSPDGDAARSADVLVLDTIGELAATYADASLVFVGGSLVPRGGHNIIEPALYARPIIVGPHTENFRQIVSDFRAAGAVRQLSMDETEPVNIGRVCAELLANRDESRRMGERAFQVLESNRGATVRTLGAIHGTLESARRRG